ncbi:MAG TPA: hypothetical protein VHB21_27550 [Minicystis sp.]|nr:hypothetical protein [Minicystis sp.]
MNTGHHPLRFVAVLALAVAGCGTSIDYTQTHVAPRPMSPHALESVEILTAGPPQRPFVEIGMIEARQQSGYSLDNKHEVLDKLRNYAANLGCDAIVVSGDNGTSSVYAGGNNNIPVTTAGYRGTCIVYTAPAPPMPQPGG